MGGNADEGDLTLYIYELDNHNKIKTKKMYFNLPPKIYNQTFIIIMNE